MDGGDPNDDGTAALGAAAAPNIPGANDVEAGADADAERAVVIVLRMDTDENCAVAGRAAGVGCNADITRLYTSLGADTGDRVGEAAVGIFMTVSVPPPSVVLTAELPEKAADLRPDTPQRQEI